MSRIDRTAMLMGMAALMSKRSTCERKQVGCVIALDGRIIATGYNGAPSGIDHCTPQTCNASKPCNIAVHAEANAIAFAARHGLALQGASMYTTLSPCKNCCELIINAGIISITFQDLHRDQSGLKLLSKAGITMEHGKWIY